MDDVEPHGSLSPPVTNFTPLAKKCTVHDLAHNRSGHRRGSGGSHRATIFAMLPIDELSVNASKTRVIFSVPCAESIGVRDEIDEPLTGNSNHQAHLLEFCETFLSRFLSSQIFQEKSWGRGCSQLRRDGGSSLGARKSRPVRESRSNRLHQGR